MLVLALDTSTPAISAGLVELVPGGEPLERGRCVRVDARAHAEQLAPAIQECLERAGVDMPAVRAVAVGVGPGPFTGLRVGLGTAAAISAALGVATYGVCSLDAIVPESGAGPYAAVTDARRKEVYWAPYAADGHRLADAAVTRPAVLPDQLASFGVVRLVGAGAQLYADVLGLPVGPPSYPDVVQLAARTAERALRSAPTERLQPLYLRRPDVAEPGPRKSVLPRR